MSEHPHDDRNDDFDEVDAMRRFPAESEWLGLPMPAGLRADGETFLQTYRRVGADPFKEALYATA